jgi:pseudaminic acid biosynthesis-associated methylase
MLTEQEQFWKGDFGDQYVGRHKELDWRARVPFWRSIVDMTGARSVLEAGCNSGANLKAITRAFRDVESEPPFSVWGCDINQAAIAEAGDAGLFVVEASLFDLKKEWPEHGFDLVFTAGVLIHVAPEDLSRAMDSIISVSNRYVLAVEYADETEVMVPYRDHAERLWRRPFGSLYEAKGLKLVAEFDAPADAFDRCRVWLCEKA